jgi:hypothetical protein
MAEYRRPAGFNAPASGLSALVMVSATLIFAYGVSRHIIALYIVAALVMLVGIWSPGFSRPAPMLRRNCSRSCT